MMMFRDEKIISPLYEAIRNSIIVLSVAGLRAIVHILVHKDPFEWTKEYIFIILAWAISIVSICFIHAFLGKIIGRIKSGIIVLGIAITLFVIYIIKI